METTVTVESSAVVDGAAFELSAGAIDWIETSGTKAVSVACAQLVMWSVITAVVLCALTSVVVYVSADSVTVWYIVCGEL